ncbi:MAG: hypothetical protein NTZ33_14220 [Bacteroidetes bacterium]|nr:hypothetical protein [Bacteroidota bacterium]
MKFIKNPITIIAILLLLFIASCSKEAGEGGTSAIQGKVYARYYNKTFTSFLGESYAPNKYVYICYGDNIAYGDKQRTDGGGSFEFKYLRKGKYKVYTFSLDTTLTNPAGQFEVLENVTITDNDQTVTTKDLLIADTPQN